MPVLQVTESQPCGCRTSSDLLPATSYKQALPVQSSSSSLQRLCFVIFVPISCLKAALSPPGARGRTWPVQCPAQPLLKINRAALP